MSVFIFKFIFGHFSLFWTVLTVERQTRSMRRESGCKMQLKSLARDDVAMWHAMACSMWVFIYNVSMCIYLLRCTEIFLLERFALPPLLQPDSAPPTYSPALHFSRLSSLFCCLALQQLVPFPACFWHTCCSIGFAVTFWSVCSSRLISTCACFWPCFASPVYQFTPTEKCYCEELNLQSGVCIWVLTFVTIVAKFYIKNL